MCGEQAGLYRCNFSLALLAPGGHPIGNRPAPRRGVLNTGMTVTQITRHAVHIRLAEHAIGILDEVKIG